MTLPLLTYNQWLLVFIGAASVILIANLLQWIVRRDRIYLLYSLYIFLWVEGFGIDLMNPAADIVAFSRTVPFYIFSMIYLELGLTFMNLSDHPRLVRWYRILQWTCFVVIIPEIYFNLFSSLWQTGWHETQLSVTRMAILVCVNLTILYTFVAHLKRADILARFFFVGNRRIMGRGNYGDDCPVYAH